MKKLLFSIFTFSLIWVAVLSTWQGTILQNEAFFNDLEFLPVDCESTNDKGNLSCLACLVLQRLKPSNDILHRLCISVTSRLFFHQVFVQVLQTRDNSTVIEEILECHICGSSFRLVDDQISKRALVGAGDVQVAVGKSEPRTIRAEAEKSDKYKMPDVAFSGYPSMRVHPQFAYQRTNWRDLVRFCVEAGYLSLKVGARWCFKYFDDKLYESETRPIILVNPDTSDQPDPKTVTIEHFKPVMRSPAENMWTLDNSIEIKL